MQYYSEYRSPLGRLLLAADEAGLTGLWFEGQKYFAHGLSEGAVAEERPVFAETKRWLDRYFAGEQPDFTPEVHLRGTPFQKAVWGILAVIPYGKTVTYGEIATQLRKELGRPMSAQAVGGAVGRNPISIIIPCHRVVGSDGSLTGYAGGMGKKQALLTLEREAVAF